MIRRPPRSTLFPTRRSSDLPGFPVTQIVLPPARTSSLARGGEPPQLVPARDRKSTRLNSSHSQISYAVFCLKKKIIRQTNRLRPRLSDPHHAFGLHKPCYPL